MADLLSTFRQKAEDLLSAIDQKGGIGATIAGLRRQMADADRRRAMGKVKAELKRLDRQITEMITAVGVQAVGLHKVGRLSSSELQPLCQHIVALEAALAQQRAELAKLESMAKQDTPQIVDLCPSCGKPLIEGGTFCPHCGSTVPELEAQRFCVYCGAAIRPQARFCAQCGQSVDSANDP